MNEKEYIDTTDLAKIRTIKTILGNCRPNISNNWNDTWEAFLRILSKWESDIDERITVETSGNKTITKVLEIEQEFSKYKMARASEHICWELKVNEFYEFCHVSSEDENNYYGSYVEGMGFFNVRCTSMIWNANGWCNWYRKCNNS